MVRPWPIALSGAALLALVTLPADAGKRRRGKIVKVEHQRSEMVKVPGGKFLMGAKDAKERAHLVFACKRQLSLAAPYCVLNQPALTPGTLLGTVRAVRRHGLRELVSTRGRSVHVSTFEIDRYEVTVAQYRRCVASGRCSLTPLVTGDRRYLRAELPIVNVTWQDAVDYCTWRAKRLPTEAEWEKAARGTRGWRWPWGNNDRKDGHNHGKRSSNATMLTQATQLGGNRLPNSVYPSFIPDASDGARLAVRPGAMRWSESPYGAYDMAGNVSEWTADWFSTLGYRGLSTFNPHRRKADPGQALRAVRGGSWAEAKYMGRTYMRGFAQPNTRSAHRGFRCARDVVQ